MKTIASLMGLATVALLAVSAVLAAALFLATRPPEPRPAPYRANPPSVAPAAAPRLLSPEEYFKPRPKDPVWSTCYEIVLQPTGFCTNGVIFGATTADRNPFLLICAGVTNPAVADLTVYLSDRPIVTQTNGVWMLTFK